VKELAFSIGSVTWDSATGPPPLIGDCQTGVSEITGFGQRNAAKSMQIAAYLP